MNKKTFHEITSVTTTYDRHGNLKERVVYTDVPLTSRTKERAKKQKILDMLIDRVEKLEIGPGFANAIATIVKADKRHYKRPKQYIPSGRGDMLFKHTPKTYMNQIELLRHMLKEPNEYCLNEDSIKKIKEKLKSLIGSFGFNFPREGLIITAFCQWTLRNNDCIKQWYSRYLQEYKPIGVDDNASIEDMKKFLVEKIKEVNGVCQ